MGRGLHRGAAAHDYGRPGLAVTARARGASKREGRAAGKHVGRRSDAPSGGATLAWRVSAACRGRGEEREGMV